MEQETEDLNASAWRSVRHSFEDEARLTLKWFIGSLLLFLVSLASWYYEYEAAKFFAIFLAVTTVITYLYFQAQVLRADMAQYHYISMLQNEKLSAKKFHD